MEKKSTNYSIPIAILIAGLIIAGVVYFRNSKSSSNQIGNDKSVTEISGLDRMKPISGDDHIRGNPNAPVKVVEYSDTECPFCKRFHPTMLQIMDEYGKSGKVAWIYRHYPIDQLHSKARTESTALECANEQGGNDIFWSYLDRLFEITPANNGLDLAQLPVIAEYVGLDVTEFNTCLASGKYDAHIEDDVQNAQATGGNGTPWSIVIGADGNKYPLSGAQPYSAVKQLIDIALGSQ